MKIIRQIGKFLCSMKCAMILLLILVLACTAGSMIPQGEVLSYYTSAYSETAAGAILLFGLDDVFHCGWFLVLVLFLCLNLLLCNVLHFPKLLGRMKNGFTLEKRLKGWDGSVLGYVKDADALFAKLGFRNVKCAHPTGDFCCIGDEVSYTMKNTAVSPEIEEKQTEAKTDLQQSDAKTELHDAKSGKFYSDMCEFRYASRNKAGIWGAWLCHLGMLVIIAGFGLGQMLKTEYTVYGVSGQTKQVGDLPYTLTIDNFEIQLREDDTVEQYLADITVTNTESGEAKSGSTWVNAPLSLFGMKFYQNSTGWAANVSVWKEDELVQDELLCAGEYLRTAEKEDLILMLRAFYPDYTEDELGNSMTASSALNNPMYLYALYYQDQVLGMNVIGDEQKITVDEYTYVFHDPQPYTLIQVKRDPFTPLAALGGLLVVTALILAFYVRPEEVWAVQCADGRWAVSGMSKKGGAMFAESVAEACREA